MSAQRKSAGTRQQLPSKPCLRCGRPMVWRKRWRAVWDEVRYCSDRCRRQTHG